VSSYRRLFSILVRLSAGYIEHHFAFFGLNSPWAGDRGAVMSKQVVEYGGQPVGIAVPENGELKFIAVKYHVMDLDNRVFPSMTAVQHAIRSLETQRAQAA
jgi:hypothetical protein